MQACTPTARGNLGAACFLLPHLQASAGAASGADACLLSAQPQPSPPGALPDLADFSVCLLTGRAEADDASSLPTRLDAEPQGAGWRLTGIPLCWAQNIPSGLSGQVSGLPRAQGLTARGTGPSCGTLLGEENRWAVGTTGFVRLRFPVPLCQPRDHASV